MAGIGVIGIVFALCVSFLHKTTPDYQPSGNPVQSVHIQKLSTKAPIVYRMVNVTGMKRKAAEQKINAIGDASLIIKWQKKYNKKAKKGILISQSIKKGESWTKGKKQTLTLTVSRGKKKIRVPNLVGLSYADAKKKLEKKKLNCRIVQRESDTISGIVLEQSKKTRTQRLHLQSVKSRQQHRNWLLQIHHSRQRSQRRRRHLTLPERYPREI